MHGLAIVILTADAEVNLREWKYLLKKGEELNGMAMIVVESE